MVVAKKCILRHWKSESPLTFHMWLCEFMCLMQVIYKKLQHMEADFKLQQKQVLHTYNRNCPVFLNFFCIAIEFHISFENFIF